MVLRNPVVRRTKLPQSLNKFLSVAYSFFQISSSARISGRLLVLEMYLQKIVAWV
jgi:hypothetical protein